MAKVIITIEDIKTVNGNLDITVESDPPFDPKIKQTPSQNCAHSFIEMITKKTKNAKLTEVNGETV